jgi:hypothetical protein
MSIVELITAKGHPKIKATHRTTLQITKDAYLSERGDCIIAVEASKGAADLSRDFVRLARSSGSVITVILEVGNIKELIHGRGSQLLTYAHPTDLVARKSRFVCDRTLMVNSDKAACDLSRKLVKLLKNPDQEVRIQLIVQWGCQLKMGSVRCR